MINSCLDYLIMMNCLCSDDLNVLLVYEFAVHDSFTSNQTLNPFLDSDVVYLACSYLVLSVM